jgi:hypothetical protein
MSGAAMSTDGWRGFAGYLKLGIASGEPVRLGLAYSVRRVLTGRLGKQGGSCSSICLASVWRLL